jgi:hypothetical protein
MLLAVLTGIAYLDSLLPVRQVYLLAFCGAIVFYVVQLYGRGFGFAFYLAACLMTGILLVDKFHALLFASFFGLAAVVKGLFPPQPAFITVKALWQMLLRLFVMNVLVAATAGLMISFFDFSPMRLLSRFSFLGSWYYPLVLLTGFVVFQGVLLSYDLGLDVANRFMKRSWGQTPYR